MLYTRRYYQGAYAKHKYRAKKYGIPFHFTFEEWFEWWGVDIDKRGNLKDSLCMCRKGDKGAYEIGNVYKDTRSNNSKFMIQEGRHGKRLPEDVVDAVRELKGIMSTRKAAAITGVSKSQVSKIWR